MARTTSLVLRKKDEEGFIANLDALDLMGTSDALD
jgi:hypothetical protein